MYVMRLIEGTVRLMCGLVNGLYLKDRPMVRRGIDLRFIGML